MPLPRALCSLSQLTGASPTGSPKRHHFQRQRAASESTEQEGDAPQADFIQYIASAGDSVAFPPPRPFLASPSSPPPTLGRYFSVDRGVKGGPVGPCPAPSPLGGPGTALLALWTRTGVTLATSWGPALQRRPEEEEGSRERPGKGRWADDGSKVSRMGPPPEQGSGLGPTLGLPICGRLRGRKGSSVVPATLLPTCTPDVWPDHPSQKPW